MPKIALPGFAMQYEEAGEGDALLMLPRRAGYRGGRFPCPDRLFRALLPCDRARSARLCGSRPPVRDFPPDFYRRDAADMLALMTALGHQRFAILGWSDGANTGAIMAAQAPERVTRLAVFGGIPI